MRLPWADEKQLRTLATGLIALAAVVLAGGMLTGERVAAVNDAMLQAPVATLDPGGLACQPETIPAGGERLRIWATLGPGPVRARAVVETGGRRLTGPWTDARGASIVVPLPGGVPAGPAELCLESAGPGAAQVLGAATGEEHRLRLREGTGAGRMRVEYLFGTGPQPLWGHAAAALPGRIAAANGSAWAPWVAGLGLLAALAGMVAVVRRPARRRERSLRREVLAVGVLALGSGALWAGLTPLFQATDELAHVAYVQAFAELGHPPAEKANSGEVSEELSCWTEVLRLDRIRFQHAERARWTRAGKDPCAGFDRRKDAALYQGVQPPAYYAMAMAAYEAGSLLDRPLPDRLLLARLVSALLAALTAISAFLLVREALPASPWPARGAALAVGLQPVLMFNHSTVNSDALVFAAATAIAAVLARAWRRGPTLRQSLLVGALLAVGVLAKITFLLVVPPAIALQVVVWLRRSGAPVRRRAALLAATWAVALVPALVYAAFADAIWEGSVQEETAVAPPADAARGQMASYVWQAFLPPLPFMEDQFPGQRFPLGHIALVGTTSRLGWWNDYGIDGPWATLLALTGAALVAFGAVTAIRRRRWRLPLVLAAGAGLLYALLLVAALYVPGTFQVQGRYLFALTAAWGLAVGAAVAGLRPRWHGHAVAVLAVGMLAWTALAVGATLSRWYF